MCGYDKAGRSVVKVRLMGGREGRQGTKATYWAALPRLVCTRRSPFTHGRKLEGA